VFAQVLLGEIIVRCANATYGQRSDVPRKLLGVLLRVAKSPRSARTRAYCCVCDPGSRMHPKKCIRLPSALWWRCRRADGVGCPTGLVASSRGRVWATADAGQAPLNWPPLAPATNAA
jgi:hypothetical protein